MDNLANSGYAIWYNVFVVRKVALFVDVVIKNPVDFLDKGPYKDKRKYHMYIK